MDKSIPEILGSYLAYMMTLPLTGLACLLTGDSKDEWCIVARKGLLGWGVVVGVVVAPFLLLGFAAWVFNQERPLLAFIQASCVVMGVCVGLYLLRGFLFGLLQGATQIVAAVFFMIFAFATLWGLLNK